MSSNKSDPKDPKDPIFGHFQRHSGYFVAFFLAFHTKKITYPPKHAELRRRRSTKTYGLESRKKQRNIFLLPQSHKLKFARMLLAHLAT